MKHYIGIDVGSVATKLVVNDSDNKLIEQLCLPTYGQPSTAVSNGIVQIRQRLCAEVSVEGVAVTGSARELVGKQIGADFIKNEITCHACATTHFFPNTQTIIEIGGQDSKLILLNNGDVTDFNMNTICAAGTGSFIDHQVSRLGLTHEQFSRLACNSISPEKLSGRCTVFANSEIVHKQQSGAKLEDIAYGLCQMLANNYLNSVAAGKEIKPPVVFQGGLALNQGIIRSLEDKIGFKLVVPPIPQLMGAYGAALLVKQKNHSSPSHFKWDHI